MWLIMAQPVKRSRAQSSSLDEGEERHVREAPQGGAALDA